MTSKLTAEDKKFRAMSDLSTLQQAEMIKSDPGRVTAAASQARQQINALQKVASKQPASKPAPKPSGKSVSPKPAAKPAAKPASRKK